MLSWMNIPGNEESCKLLQEIMASGKAIAVIGPDVSLPLYPTEKELVKQVLDLAESRSLISSVERQHWIETGSSTRILSQLKRKVGSKVMTVLLIDILPNEGKPPFTPLQGVLMRMPFCGYVTMTNDRGLEAARSVFRGDGVTSSTLSDKEVVTKWISGEIFETDPCPILHLRGVYDRPETLWLADDDSILGEKNYITTLNTRLKEKQRLVIVGFDMSKMKFLVKIPGEIRRGRHHIVVAGATPQNRMGSYVV